MKIILAVRLTWPTIPCRLSLCWRGVPYAGLLPAFLPFLHNAPTRHTLSCAASARVYVDHCSTTFAACDTEQVRVLTETLYAIARIIDPEQRF